MNNKEYTIISIIIGMIIGTCIVYFSYQLDKENHKTISFKRHSKYQVYSIDIPKNLDFAGEPLPIDKPGILERLDQEIVKNTFYHSSTILTIKRANRIFPDIERILKQYGVPDDFKYLAVAESNLRNVTSPAGAVGYWQFMKVTGKQYGLEISEEEDDFGNPILDERLDPIKSTHAAAKYFKDMRKELGSWTNVAAAYNRGINGFKRAQQKQKVTSFYDLRLNQETSRYIFRIIALKEIIGKPQKYGFNVNEKHKYKTEKTQTVKVDTAIYNLVDFAHSYSITYKTLREFNPWINDTKLLNKKGKTYKIVIPLKTDLEKPKSPLTKRDSVKMEQI